jgi:branched-chain amino acid aminotransferase
MYYDPQTIIYYNGQFGKAAEAATDLYGQSLHYGYAVFEGIRSYHTDNGTRIFKAREHYDRLLFSANALHIPVSYTTDQLIDLTYQLLEKNNFTDAYIRPLILCPPNMSLSKATASAVAILAWEWTNGYLANNMRITTSSYARPNPAAFKVEAKISGHYVNSILACTEAKMKGYDEALLLDANGYVAEGPGANVFYEKDGILYTPARGNILPGITRATVLEICGELGIPVHETLFTPDAMRGADSAFYCGTAAEIVALASLDDVPFRLKWEDALGAIIQQAYRCRVLEKSFTLQQAVA